MANESDLQDSYHVVVVGGGPAGSTTAHILARAGIKVLVIERRYFPRFHIGESLLPRNMTLFRELGLEEKLLSLPHLEKHGAEIIFGHETEPTFIFFNQSLNTKETFAVNLERGPFDKMLLEQAELAGAKIHFGTAAGSILHLKDGDVALVIGNRTIHAKYLVDASGQATFLGKHLGTRQVLPNKKKVAYFGHFKKVFRNQGIKEGFPTIVMMKDGWFWIIPLDKVKTSIGLVMDQKDAAKTDIPSSKMLEWGISRCPVMRQRTSSAVFPNHFEVAADFSYRCQPYAGPGYFLVGDSATFIDPVFSTGVCIGMMSGARAAEDILKLLRKDADPEATRKKYIQFIKNSTYFLFRFVDNFYKHPFRELLVQGKGPLDIHRALYSLLAGNVFPKPDWSLRWRFRLFEVFIKIQRFFPMAPRRQSYSILDGVPRRGNSTGTAPEL